MNRRWFAVVIILIGILVSLAAFLWRLPHFRTNPHPAKTFEEAMDKFAALEKSESLLPLSREGRSRLLSHGGKTKRVFVLLHGLTNCPEQFMPLARILYTSGANVVIPRARYAGFADLMNEAQGLQSGQDLLDQATTGLDIAAGLGDHISLVGLSGSSVAAVWMAQTRPGIDSMLIISPFFSLYGHSEFSIDALAAILVHLPNSYKWWDETRKTASLGPPYAYPRYGTYCMASTIQLSRDVRAHLTSRPLRIRRLSILTTGTDKGANNRLTAKLATAWAQQDHVRVSTFQFPPAQNIPHDMIDPHQPGAKTEMTYAKILELLEVDQNKKSD